MKRTRPEPFGSATAEGEELKATLQRKRGDRPPPDVAEQVIDHLPERGGRSRPPGLLQLSPSTYFARKQRTKSARRPAGEQRGRHPRTMNTYSGPAEVFANGQWHAARAELSGTRTMHEIRTYRGRNVVDGLEDWGGYITMSDDTAAHQVYEDDGCKLRLPNGEERTFVASSFSNPLNIKGNGSIPFD